MTNKISKISLNIISSSLQLTFNDVNIKEGRIMKNSNSINIKCIVWNNKRKRIQNYIISDIINEDACIDSITEWNGIYPLDDAGSVEIFQKGSIRRKHELDMKIKNKSDLLNQIALECSRSPIVNDVLLEYLDNGVILHSDFNAIRELTTMRMDKNERLMKQAFSESTLLKSWQIEMVKLFELPADRRTIIWIYDPMGNTGKTFLGQHLEGLYPQQVICCQTTKAADILYVMQDLHVCRGVIIDLTRSKGGTCISYDFIEQIKSGNVLSTKYKPRRRHFLPLHVFVMANGRPDVSKLSLDRWKIVEIENNTESPGDHVLRWWTEEEIENCIPDSFLQILDKSDKSFMNDVFIKNINKF